MRVIVSDFVTLLSLCFLKETLIDYSSFIYANVHLHIIFSFLCVCPIYSSNDSSLLVSLACIRLLEIPNSDDNFKEVMNKISLFKI